MGAYTTLDGRITMDQAAFARFCETRSIDGCFPADGQKHPGWAEWLAVDADNDKTMLEADNAMMRQPRLLTDLRKAAEAGQVDGAYMSGCNKRGNRQHAAVVFRNSELWAGVTRCLTVPVDVSQWADNNGDIIRLISRRTPLQPCDCSAACRKRRMRPGIYGGINYKDGFGPVVDIETFMPAPASGQLEQALIGAVGDVWSDGRLAIGRLAWNATGPGQEHVFRRWLGTFKEVPGERSVTWLPDLFDHGGNSHVPPCGPNGKMNFRPVCAFTGGTQRGACPAFVTGPGNSHVNPGAVSCRRRQPRRRRQTRGRRSRPSRRYCCDRSDHAP